MTTIPKRAGKYTYALAALLCPTSAAVGDRPHGANNSETTVHSMLRAVELHLRCHKCGEL